MSKTEAMRYQRFLSFVDSLSNDVDDNVDDNVDDEDVPKSNWKKYLAFFVLMSALLYVGYKYYFPKVENERQQTSAKFQRRDEISRDEEEGKNYIFTEDDR